MASTGPAIHTGYWIDHSKGVVLGGTLTYSQNAGSQLISAATILVQLAGASVWALFAFFLHQRAVKKGLQDEYDAQKQVVLRNHSSPAGTLLTLYNLGWTWRGHTSNAWKRTLVHMLLPFTIWVGFTVAGIFVGQIAENPYQTQVLLKSDICGMIDTTNSSSSADIRFGQLYGSNISSTADAYARDCYALSTTDSVTCGSYATARLAYTKMTNGSCPIGLGNCDPGDGQAVNLYASNIDSHDDLGINAKAADRLQIQYNVTCAPVKRELLNSYIVYDDSDGIRDSVRNYSSMQLHIGKDLENGYDVPYNYSQVVKWWGNQITRYSLNSFSSKYPHQGLGNWLPVSPFNQTEADVVIYIIAANTIVYSAPNNDPIFSTANQTIAGDSRFYLSDHYFRALVCTQNYQICKDQGSNCTPWSPISVLEAEVNRLQLTPKQNATWLRMGEVIINSGMDLAISTASPLRASDQLIATSTSAGLPDNQWTIEVEAWFQAVLARMQYISQSFVALPSFILSQTENVVVLPPDTPESQAQCNNQRIQTPPGYTSYSVFALVFIFVVAVIIIGSAIFIAEFSHKLPHRHPGGKNYHKRIAYQADGMLQLQRMALEGAGYTGWKGGRGNKKEVPYTEHGNSRVPPPIVEQRSRHNTRSSVEGGEDGEGIWDDDGLLYYEKAAAAEDESDGPMLRK